MFGLWRQLKVTAFENADSAAMSRHSYRQISHKCQAEHTPNTITNLIRTKKIYSISVCAYCVRTSKGLVFS